MGKQSCCIAFEAQHFGSYLMDVDEPRCSGGRQSNVAVAEGAAVEGRYRRDDSAAAQRVPVIMQCSQSCTVRSSAVAPVAAMDAKEVLRQATRGRRLLKV